MGFETYIIPTVILLAGVVNDLYARKVKNSLSVFCAILAIAWHIYFSGLSGLGEGSLAAVTALILMLPLVLSRALGAGDMKLFIAFGFATNWNAVLVTAIASLFCGALLGVFRAVLSGEGLTLVKNTGALMKGANIGQLKTTKIPYTVALLFGWATFVSLQFHGGSL